MYYNFLPMTKVRGPLHPGFRNQITGETVWSDGSRASIDAIEEQMKIDLVALMTTQDMVGGVHRPEQKDLATRQRAYQLTL